MSLTALALLSTLAGQAEADTSTATMPWVRADSLCSISLKCFEAEDGSFWGGLLLIPQANIGLIQVPFGSDRSPGYADAIGSFKPTVGVTAKLWLYDGLLDGHAQLIYGAAPAIEGRDNYLWGVSVGAGGVGVVNVDIAFLNRRFKDNAQSVDSGVALLINLDLTGAGLLLGSSFAGGG